LTEQSFKVRVGMIIDATIICVPGSTKNGDGRRDPEWQQNHDPLEWRFGMKAHTGVGSWMTPLHVVTAAATGAPQAREMTHAPVTAVVD
jgi:IS5 family transposase